MTFEWLKRTAAILALCLAIGSVSGCDGGEGAESGTAETSDTAEGTQEAKVVYKIGYIFEGDCNGTGLAAQLNNQRMSALSHSNVESVYIDNVNITDFEKAVEMLVNDGCTHIVAASPIYNHSVTALATRYMNIRFVNFGSTQRGVNVFAYTDNSFEPACAVGLAAAFNSKSEKIGVVTDPFLSYDVAVTNAVALGTQFVYENAETIVATATRPAEIREAVDTLIRMGCDVIISYTASGETAEYCEQRGVKFVGNFDYSGRESDYEHMIMYFYTDRSSFFLSQNKSIALETWNPDAYIGTLANGVLNVSAALDAADDGTQDIVDALIPKIANGSYYIFSGELKDNNGNVRISQGREMVYSDIYSMSWYVDGVNSELETFVQTVLHPETSELIIKS